MCADETNSNVRCAYGGCKSCDLVRHGVQVVCLNDYSEGFALRSKFEIRERPIEMGRLLSEVDFAEREAKKIAQFWKMERDGGHP